jgi:hypothetical protein
MTRCPFLSSRAQQPLRRRLSACYQTLSEKRGFTHFVAGSETNAPTVHYCLFFLDFTENYSKVGKALHVRLNQSTRDSYT